MTDKAKEGETRYAALNGLADIGGLKGHRKVTNQVSRPQMTTELPVKRYAERRRIQHQHGCGNMSALRGKADIATRNTSQ